MVLIVICSKYHNCVDTINMNTHFEILLKYKAKIIKPMFLLFLRVDR